MINAKISASGNHATSAARLNGTADLEISFGEFSEPIAPVVARIITFTVSGFQTTTSIDDFQHDRHGQFGTGSTGGQTSG